MAVAFLAGCSKAPDAAGEWQGDGEWHALQAAQALREQDRQARVVVPSMPPLPKDVTQPNKTVAQFYNRLRLSLRPDGTCHFGAARSPGDAGNESRDERHLAELIRVVALVPDVDGNWRQSRWQVTPGPTHLNHSVSPQNLLEVRGV